MLDSSLLVSRSGSGLRFACRDAAAVIFVSLVSLGLSVTGCSPAAGPANTAVPASTAAAPVAGEGLTVRGSAPPVAGGFRAVVLLAPEDGHAVAVPDAPETMDQFGLSFLPGVLVVRAGQEVAFTNGDDVLHNVHVAESATRETVFNIATPIAGAYLHTFERPGTYTVACNVHPAMAAYILVTDAAYVAVAERDGRFELSGVPPGRYRVTVWSVNAALRSERQVEIGAETELRLHTEG